MTRGSRLIVLALGAAACLNAPPASSQMIIGENRPNVEVNWSVLDKLGPEPTLPSIVTRKPAPPPRSTAPVKKGVEYKSFGQSTAPVVAEAKAPKAPKSAPLAKVAVEKVMAPEPVPERVKAPAPVVEAKAPVENSVPSVPAAEKVVASAQPPKPPKVEIATEVPLPPKPVVDAKGKTPASAVQFVKAPEQPVTPPAPPPAPVVVAPPAPPLPAPVVAAPPPMPMPVVQPVAPAPQLAAAAPVPSAPIRKGDNASVVFAAESSHLPDVSRAELDRIAQKMERDESLNLQLLAYAAGDEANASKARRMSLSRALEVRKYLMEMGVRSTRIEVRALGNKIEGSPADRVDVVLAVR